MNWQMHLGDALSVLQTLPPESVQCIVTSPPYFGLRDYGAEGQVGLEPTPLAFAESLVAVFNAVRRVLRDDGVLWLNLGDSYASSGPAGGVGKQHTNVGTIGVPVRKPPEGTKPKDLIGVPWMVAFALRDAGWYLRADVVWSKPNPMPESVQDRVTKSHEYCFHLTKSARYAYDAAAIREPLTEAMLAQMKSAYTGQPTKDYPAEVQTPTTVKARIVAGKRDKQRGHTRRHAGFNDRWDEMERTEQLANGANARSVWTIATEPSPYEHFAVMPKALARKCILAGCPYGGTVLDPFAGVATTGVVALQEGRSFVGIELNAKYHAIARQRLSETAPLLAQEVGA